MRFAVLVALVSVSAFACTAARDGGAAAGESGATTELVVYAAASLGDVFRELASAYEAERPGTRVVLSFDASSVLRARIAAGAHADVLAAADTDNPERLAREGLTAGAPVPFAVNELAVVVPLANRAGLDDVLDLAKPGVRIVAAGDDVPISRYSRALVARLTATPGAPRDFATGVTRNIASREDNVRSVLTKVELGEADAGIVYRTDAASSARVRSIAIPAAANVRATYAAVAIRQRSMAAESDAGASFVAWLRSDRAAAILTEAGFGLP